MSNIFVSYSRSDQEKVDKIVDRFREKGHEVWLDREGLQGGDDWRERVAKAIDRCSVFAIVLSQNSVDSIVVHKELRMAEQKDKKILPIRLEKVGIPDKMLLALSGLHVIDVSRSFEKLDSWGVPSDVAGSAEVRGQSRLPNRPEIIRTVQIAAPSERVWRAVMEVEKYPEWQPGVRRIKNPLTVLERDAEGRPRRVKWRVGLGLLWRNGMFRYVLGYDYDPPQRVSWKAERGPHVWSMDGSYEVVALPGGGTQVIHAFRLRPTTTFPRGLRRRIEVEIVEARLRALKLHCERTMSQ